MAGYIVKIIFQINNSSLAAQFDEQYRLVLGKDHSEVFQKACRLAQTEEESFATLDNQTISWSFVGISSIYPIERLHDGIELFSNIVESNEMHDYLEIVRIRHQAFSVESRLSS